MGDWMTVRVELVSGQGTDLDPRPGRVFIVAPDNTFHDLADAINLHFARWDAAHLHLFRLSDGREIGDSDDESPEWLDHDVIAVSSAVSEGDRFEYIFDLGEEWMHDCRVEEVGIDPIQIFGEAPDLPTPIWGWGSMPDQHGRQSEKAPAT